jgi:transposase
MSTSPYSIDLRKKIIDCIESGKSQKELAALFKINPSTISRWWIRYKTEGHYNPRVRIGKKPKINAAELKNYVESNPNFKTSEMGKHFGMSSVGALYWLRKLGYSYKKKPSPMWKLVRKKELHTRN